MNENNQCGMAMTKPQPFGCIKKIDQPHNLAEFNKILNEISYEDSVGHLFIVDIKFNNINPKILLFDKLYSPIFEMNKKMEPYERLTLQLLSIMVWNEGKEKINSFPYNSKTHSALKE